MTPKDKKTKVFCLYNDGDHIECFEKEADAERFARENYIRLYAVYEEDYDPNCECENKRIKEAKS